MVACIGVFVKSDTTSFEINISSGPTLMFFDSFASSGPGMMNRDEGVYMLSHTWSSILDSGGNDESHTPPSAKVGQTEPMSDMTNKRNTQIYEN